MPDSQIFCNVPWFEVHINADGTYHTCGAQPNHMTGSDMAATYCVQNMSIPEWMSSDWQRQARLDKLHGQASVLCSMCYHEEKSGSSSKRQRENLKSSIDSRDFDRTWTISPDRQWFDFSLSHDGHTNRERPISYHISLGNECNLACHMCFPAYSSRIAAELKKAGEWSGPARLNWTQDDRAWQQVTDYMCDTENLRWVHVIGGEPMMNPRFGDLVRRLRMAGRTDIYFGFTTNGTIMNEDLVRDLLHFRHVDIGISIECMEPLNSAVRRGSDTALVLANIERYLSYRRPGQVYVTVRTVPSALSVHTLDQLYAWCRDRGIDVMSNILVQPPHLNMRHLPDTIKRRLLEQYGRWSYSQDQDLAGDPRDPNRYQQHIDSEIRAITRALQSPGDLAITQQLYAALGKWGWLDNNVLQGYFLE